jgi:hypothetical protein
MQFALQSKQAMLAARAYTDPQAGSASGIFLAGRFERLGIAGAMLPRRGPALAPAISRHFTPA